MNVRIRTLGGGESVFLVDKNCLVDDLRHEVQWCIDNKDWSSRNLVKSGRTRSRSKAPDEMWSLNDSSHPSDCQTLVVDESDHLNDFETAMSNALEVHECERKTIELLFGTQVLEVRVSQLKCNYCYRNSC